MTDKAKQVVEAAISSNTRWYNFSRDQGCVEDVNLHKTIQKALEIMQLLLGDDGKQPIETAPKDGTKILVINGDKGGYGGYCGGSQEPYNKGVAFFDGEWMANDCCDGVSTYKPAHWKPLTPKYEAILDKWKETL